MDIRRILCLSATAAMLFCVVEGGETQPPAKESEEMTSEPNSNAEFSGIAPYGAPNMLPPYMANSFGSYPYGSGYGLNNQYPVSPIRSPIATPSIYGQYNPFGQPPVPQNRYLPSPFGGAFNPYSGYPNQGLGFGFDFGCTPVSVQGDATYCVQGPVCSGSGIMPAGFSCPGAGSQAVGDCSSDKPSYRGGYECALRTHSQCAQIGYTWGCRL